MDSKILEAGRNSQMFEKLREDANAVMAQIASVSHAKLDAIGSMTALLNMVEQADAYVKGMRAFVDERERLGEYDASATAIIELSKVMLRMMEFQLVAMRATINFRLEN